MKILFAGAILLVLFTVSQPWLGNNPYQDLFGFELPPGQWQYLLSKLIAQLAYIGLTIQLIIGLITRKAQHSLTPARMLYWHRIFGVVVVGLIATHIGLFMTAAGLRSGEFPVKLLMFRFDDGYYQFYVSVGLLSLCGLLVAISFAALRARLPAKLANYGHQLVWLAWALAFVHSFAIGSDTASWNLWSMLHIGLLLSVSLFFIFNKIERLKST